MKELARKHLLTVVGILVGAVAGYLYWQQIGCSSGSCAITSKPLNSTLYGALLGGLLFSIIKKIKRKTMTFQEIINQDKPVLVDFFCGMVWSLQNAGTYSGRIETTCGRICIDHQNRCRSESAGSGSVSGKKCTHAYDIQKRKNPLATIGSIPGK